MPLTPPFADLPVAAAVQQYFGLSGRALAVWLGVRPQRLADAEAFRRPLPLAALPRLALLATLLPLTPTVPALPAPDEPPLIGQVVPPQPLGPADASILRQRQHTCTRHAATARQRLAALQALAAAATARLAALPRLQAAHAALETGAGPPAVAGAWLNVFRLEAEEWLRTASPAAQALLALRISALEYEAAQAGALATAVEGAS